MDGAADGDASPNGAAGGFAASPTSADANDTFESEANGRMIGIVAPATSALGGGEGDGGWASPPTPVGGGGGQPGAVTDDPVRLRRTF